MTAAANTMYGVFFALGTITLAALPLFISWLANRAYRRTVRQTQFVRGDNSTSIQAAGDLTITAVGGSVAALRVGSVSIGEGNPTRRRREALVEQAAKQRNVAEIPVRPFTAWSDCPGCGETAVHPLREPRFEDLSGFPAEFAVPATVFMVLASAEQEGVVVRQCSCGQEWREK